MSDTATLEHRRNQLISQMREFATQNRGRNEDLIMDSIVRTLEGADTAQAPLVLIPYLKNLMRNKLGQIEDISNLMSVVSALSMVNAAIEDSKSA
jgi:hypothetical protein